jgi:hypothetical protein
VNAAVWPWFSFSYSNAENNSFDNNFIQTENITHKFSSWEFIMFHAAVIPTRPPFLPRFRAELLRLLAQMGERR